MSEQAFPSHPILYGSAEAHRAQGMTLRDYFAGQALIGLIASDYYNARGPGFAEFIAAEAGRIADAMLVERAKQEAAE